MPIFGQALNEMGKPFLHCMESARLSCALLIMLQLLLQLHWYISYSQMLYTSFALLLVLLLLLLSNCCSISIPIIIYESDS